MRLTKKQWDQRVHEAFVNWDVDKCREHIKKHLDAVDGGFNPEPIVVINSQIARYVLKKKEKSITINN